MTSPPESRRASPPQPPQWLSESIARTMHAQNANISRREHAMTPPPYEQHAEMWLARAEPYAQAVWDAMLANSEVIDLAPLHRPPVRCRCLRLVPVTPGVGVADGNPDE